MRYESWIWKGTTALDLVVTSTFTVNPENEMNLIREP